MRFFPQSGRRLTHRHAYRFHLDTGAGAVEIRACQGQDPTDGRWGLETYQQMSPGWQQHLCAVIEARLNGHWDSLWNH